MINSLSILGPGVVGTALGALGARAGWRVVVGGRNLARTQAAARLITEASSQASPHAQQVVATDFRSAAAKANLVLLTVRDDVIEQLCDELAAAGAFTPGSVVAHVSGALDSTVLASARRAGCHVGSMHPLQTLPSVAQAVESLPGCWCFIEGDDLAVQPLEALARDIGMRPARLAGPQAKALYHAAACVASNYLVTLLAAATECEAAAGIDQAQALDALGPLVRATVENVLKLGPASALTGPIARGDAGTIQRHLTAIADARPALESFYRQLGLLTLELAVRKGTLSGDDARRLRDTLGGTDTQRTNTQ